MGRLGAGQAARRDGGDGIVTVIDMPRFRAALLRLCACFDRQLTTQQRDAWYEQLERYSIDAVEQAMREVPALSGRFFPTVGQLEQLARKALAATPRRLGDWHAPEVERDDDGLVVARWRCGLCHDKGWRGVRADTGQLLTHEEWQDYDRTRTPGAREDGLPHVSARRCACRLPAQAVAS